VAERVFARKVQKVGFTDLEIFGHTPYGIDDVARYPLFPAELIQVMRKVLPAARQRHLATGVIVRARKAEL
jgi:hypothetical protein